MKIQRYLRLGRWEEKKVKARLLSFREATDHALKPALIEALSKLEEPRMVPLAYQSLQHLPSQVVQLQILSAVARVVGG